MNHKIICGDCLDVMKDIPDKSIDMILCDLPYGTTSCKWDTIIPLEGLWKEYNRIIKDDRAIVLTASQPFTTTLISSNIKMFRYEWIWNKSQSGNPFLVKKQPLKIHENVLVFNAKRYFPIKRKGKIRIKGGGKNSQLFGNTLKQKNDEYYPTSIIEISNCSKKK